MEVIPTVFSTNEKDFIERLKKIKAISKEIQVDIMDGEFVNTKSIPIEKIPSMIGSKYLLEAHLMVKNPEKYFEPLRKKGFKKIIFHYETIKIPEKIIKMIKEIKRRGMHAIIAINPNTKPSELKPVLPEIHHVLIMGVKPGKENQKLDPKTYKKIRWFKKNYPRIKIQIDGGVNKKTAKKLYAAGADTLNSGSYVIKSKNPKKALEELKLKEVKLKELKKMNNKEINKLKKKARLLRKHVIEMIAEAGSGHPGGSLGMADIFSALYFKFLKLNPKKPNDPGRDYLILSNGHICPVMYAAMAEKGFFPASKLKNLRKIGSELQGHPHRETLQGLETTSGPLGSGLSQAAGIALGLKMDKKNNRVVCITSDGEHDEGNIWEAILFAHKYRLNNLTVIIDRNKVQLSGKTEEIMPLDSLKEKYLSFGWEVIEINGNNMDEIYRALEQAFLPREAPLAIIANTILGKGVSFMENNPAWHGKAPTKEQATEAIKQIEKN